MYSSGVPPRHRPLVVERLPVTIVIPVIKGLREAGGST